MIYNFLCDKKIKSKIMKKVPANKQFDTYSAWENYVKSLYSNAPLGELKEFKKYLNNKSRSNNNHNNWTNNILIPITITIISVVITPFIFVITNNYNILNDLQLSNVFIKVVLLVIIFPALFSLLICFILKMVSLASEAFLDTK